VFYSQIYFTYHM